VRSALSYVLNNWRHHDELRGCAGTPFDPYSSARAFDGWSIPWRRRIHEDSELLPTAIARTWVLRTGWKRHRLIAPTETPGEPQPRRDSCKM
jgi:hypothetical protein